MNKIYKLIWNTSLGQWVVCSELGKKTKSSAKATLLIGGVLLSSVSFAVECNKLANGSVIVNNSNNTGANINCEVSSIPTAVGNESIYNQGFLVYSQNADKSITVTKDLTTTVKGSTGISVYGTNRNDLSLFDATGKTIDLTITNIDSNSNNPNGDDITKAGLDVSHGGTAKIGALKLNMENLPIGGGFNRHEHYGVVTGSSVKSGEPDTFNGMRSSALFDNLDIKMSANNSGLLSAYPLVVGIRAIQGASNNNAGNGSAGYVKVNNDLNIDIENPTLNTLLATQTEEAGYRVFYLKENRNYAPESYALNDETNAINL